MNKRRCDKRQNIEIDFGGQTKIAIFKLVETVIFFFKKKRKRKRIENGKC